MITIIKICLRRRDKIAESGYPNGRQEDGTYDELETVESSFIIGNIATAEEGIFRFIMDLVL
ncbi:hypothetical protein OXPF_24480 [Oxobacter pfennigii]|uniref:Uncharacterized protein n=1 Tax=Oxobacter pfennigii TaxID=36849 RepID=A0A0N8NTA4_9CLOT|nr:hypothetical protein [Oxobacter pfennigii]KPU44280.1 hypothetical protein OXPF_24480 [Oxobacter pfennigii]